MTKAVFATQKVFFTSWAHKNLIVASLDNILDALANEYQLGPMAVRPNCELDEMWAKACLARGIPVQIYATKNQLAAAGEDNLYDRLKGTIEGRGAVSLRTFGQGYDKGGQDAISRDLAMARRAKAAVLVRDAKQTYKGGMERILSGLDRNAIVFTVDSKTARVRANLND